MKMRNKSHRLSTKQIGQKTLTRDLKEQQDWAGEMKKSASFRARIKIEYRQNFVRILKEKMEKLNSK